MFYCLGHVYKVINFAKVQSLFDKEKNERFNKRFRKDTTKNTEADISKINPSRISVRSSKGIRIIGFKEIMYCLADGRYTRIFLENGETHLIAKVLRNYESLLPKESFFRIHKSCIVNISFIKEYCLEEQKYLVLTNNKVLSVAKRRCKSFLEKLLTFFPS